MTAISEAEIRALGQSGMFDAEWYQATYPDVALLGMSPAEHYLWLGRRLGRPGRPRSEPSKSGAVIRAESGQAEIGRVAGDRADVSALAHWSGFDPAYVCKQLAIAESRDREKVARHYYERSRSLNILPNPLFDPEYYRQANKLSFKDDMLQHYLSVGAAAQLRTHRLFDHEWYKRQVPSALSSRDLVSHYWEHGYPQRILPVDPEKVAILPEVAQAFFSGAEGGAINDFDPIFCRSYNPDLAHLGDAELREHYERHGRSEKRVASLAVLLAESKTLGRFVPLDFDPEEYIALHADLELAFQDRPWGSLNHYLSGGMSEARTYCEAQLYGAFSPPDEIYDERVIDDLVDKVPLCVLVHLYYPEMWDELKEYIERIDVAFDLYVNFVESTWTTEAIAKIRAFYPEAHIQISPNEGRDIGGFFRLLDHVDFKRYVAFTMMHSKKSPHVSAQYAAIWKKNLLGAILGDSGRIKQNIAAFIQDTEIGIIGAMRTRHTSMDQNLDRMGKLFDIYHISEENRDCEYVSGTMMMVRSEVMRAVYEPMKSYKFLSGDGKGLNHHVDGQLEHSIERIFGNVMKECGCKFLWR